MMKIPPGRHTFKIEFLIPQILVFLNGGYCVSQKATIWETLETGRVIREGIAAST